MAPAFVLPSVLYASPLRNCSFAAASAPLRPPTRRRARPSPSPVRASAAPASPTPPPSPTPSEPAPTDEHAPPYAVREWTFRSFRVRYAEAGAIGSDQPAVVLVHGFGANCEHWRHNLGPLAERGFRVYAMDLLGFGLGAKPAPGTADGHPNGSEGAEQQGVHYTFDYWTAQLREFLDTVVRPGSRPVFLVANSIGCMVTMQLATEEPDRVAALVFISPSLRQLNIRKRSALQDVTAPLLMRLLSYRPVGQFFLDALAKPDALRRVLASAYSVHSAIDDDLVRILGEPARTDGALDVFLSFITYDTGPIPEDFLPDLGQPSLVLWGEDDQFEPFELGQKLRHYATVEAFVPMPATGHCAHDERPEECNKLVGEFLDKHTHRTQLPT